MTALSQMAVRQTMVRNAAKGKSWRVEAEIVQSGYFVGRVCPICDHTIRRGTAVMVVHNKTSYVDASTGMHKDCVEMILQTVETVETAYDKIVKHVHETGELPGVVV